MHGFYRGHICSILFARGTPLSVDKQKKVERLILREEAYSQKFEQCDSACSCVSTYSGEILEPLPLPPRESPAAPYLRHLSFLVNLRDQESALLKLLV